MAGQQVIAALLQSLQEDKSPRFDISKGWTPDFLPYDVPPGGCQIVENVVPFLEHYTVMPSGVDFSTGTVSGTVLNAFRIRRGATLATFIGTSTGLYRLESDHTITNLSRPAAYNTASGETWSWTIYGDWIIASNFSDDIQVIKAATRTQAAVTSITQVAGTATATTTANHGLANNDNVIITGANQAGYNITATVTVTGVNTFTYAVNAATVSPATGTILWERAFQNLGGSPPKARYLLNVRGIIIAGNLYESSTYYPRRLRWAALENPESWTASATTLSGYQDMSDLDGTIKGMGRLNANSFTIYSEDSLSTGEFVGAPYKFRFNNNIVSGYGLVSAGTIAEINNGNIFWGRDDVYLFNGQTVTPMAEGVRKTLMEYIDLENSHMIWTAHDPVNTMLYVTIPTLENTDDYPNRLICHNYGKGRFTYINVSAPAIVFVQPNLTLDDLTFLGYLDDLVYKIDDRIFTAQGISLGYVNKNTGKVALFLGMPYQGKILTGEIYNSKRLLCTRVKPLCNRAVTGAVSCRVGHRDEISDEVSYTSSVTAGSHSYCDVGASGKHLSLEITLGRHFGISSVETEMIQLGDF